MALMAQFQAYMYFLFFHFLCTYFFSFAVILRQGKGKYSKMLWDSFAWEGEGKSLWINLVPMLEQTEQIF